MRRVSSIYSLFIAVTFWLGCGDSRPAGTAGNDSSLVGGACAVNPDCDERLCEIGASFPDGLCT
ncbi:MAG: hypothetical protein WCE62_12965, partial [Polyangiales bacterium]